MGQDAWTDVDRYFSDHLVESDTALDGALRDSAAAGLPAINVAPVQGKLLHLLARTRGARTILEIGTLGGYSTIWLARALPAGGRLVTLEADAGHADVARANLARAGLSGTVEVITGPALETLPRLAAAGRGPFDLVFIDADKPSNPAYLAWALELSRPGTVIITDNVVRDGRVVDDGSTDPKVRGVRRFVELVAAEPRLSATAIQTVGVKGYDGFALALVDEPDPAPEAPSVRETAPEPAPGTATGPAGGLRERLRALDVFAGDLPAFDTDAAPAEPGQLFVDWLVAAIEAGVPEPHAMTLSTVDPAGDPAARTLILKDVTGNGWQFATHAASPKGRDLAAHGRAALTFYWPKAARQVRVRGAVHAEGAERSAEDFLARAPGARAEALLGLQSGPLADPDTREALTRESLARVEREPGLVAPEWTVYTLRADEVEFWQGDRERRHTRLDYTRDGAGWSKRLLWP